MSLSLHTQDVGGISKLDVELARAANHYFEGLGAAQKQPPS